jgi:hypothetical protein
MEDRIESIRELLIDYEDLRDLRMAKSEDADAPTMSMNEVFQRYVGEASKPKSPAPDAVS